MTQSHRKMAGGERTSGKKENILSISLQNAKYKAQHSKPYWSTNHPCNKASNKRLEQVQSTLSQASHQTIKQSGSIGGDSRNYSQQLTPSFEHLTTTGKMGRSGSGGDYLTSHTCQQANSTQAPAPDRGQQGGMLSAKPPITARLLQPQENLEDILNNYIQSTTVEDSAPATRILRKRIFTPRGNGKFGQPKTTIQANRSSFLEMIPRKKVKKKPAQERRIFINSALKKY